VYTCVFYISRNPWSVSCFIIQWLQYRFSYNTVCLSILVDVWCAAISTFQVNSHDCPCWVFYQRIAFNCQHVKGQRSSLFHMKPFPVAYSQGIVGPSLCAKFGTALKGHTILSYDPPGLAEASTENASICDSSLCPICLPHIYSLIPLCSLISISDPASLGTQSVAVISFFLMLFSFLM
jgi:hypothetical protein